MPGGWDFLNNEGGVVGATMTLKKRGISKNRSMADKINLLFVLYVIRFPLHITFFDLYPLIQMTIKNRDGVETCERNICNF